MTYWGQKSDCLSGGVIQKGAKALLVGCRGNAPNISCLSRYDTDGNSYRIGIGNLCVLRGCKGVKLLCWVLGLALASFRNEV